MGIELHDDGLYVVRLVASYIGIGRKSLFVAGISCQGIEYTGLFLKLMLRAPETSAGKDANLYTAVFRHMIDVNLRAFFDGCLNHFQCLAMFLLKVWVVLTSLKVMLEVIVLHLKCNGILRIDNALHIIEIISSRLMCKDAKGIHYTCGNTFMKQILKGVGGIFYHIMQKACHLFLVCMAHQAHCEWMKNNRIAIAIKLTGMG